MNHPSLGLKSRLMLRALAAIALAGALFVSSIEVGAAQVPQEIEFDIPAQALEPALFEFSRQAGMQVMAGKTVLDGQRTRGIKGRFAVSTALAALLRGTALTFETDSNTITVRSAKASDAQAALVPLQTLTLVQNTQSSEVLSPVSGNETKEAAQEVLVTGSRLKRIDSEAALPVKVYTRQDIENSGQASLSQFLMGLNEVSLGQGEGSFTGPVQGQGTVQLRGLPLGTSLVLVNGRRMQAVGNSSSNFFNMNLIPLTAVERVEVLSVGSSAVYGGDALAGVVNIILRNSAEGMSLSARASSGEGFGEGGIAFSVGDRGERGGWIVLGSYSKSTPLMLDEREFFRDADYRRFGGVDGRERNCTPGTVTNSTTANLPGLNSTFAAIPVTAQNQSLTTQSFAATAGQANLCSYLTNGGASSLIHGTELLGMHASGHHAFSKTLTGFGELTFTRDKTESDGLGFNVNNVLVPATNPNNPFGVPVRVTGRLGVENGQEAYIRDTDFVRALVGLSGGIGAGWDFEGTASISRDDGARVRRNGTVDTTARAAALATSDRAASLNLFATGRAASDEVLSQIWRDSVRDAFGRKLIVSGFVRGPLFQLPAGSVDVIAGSEAAWDDYRSVEPGVFSTETDRRARAFYGELRAPLWKANGAGKHDWNLAALTVAARRDRYSDFGSAATYQAGLEFRPVRTLLLRASGGTSFKPPSLLQTNVEEQLIPLASLRLVDPLRNNEPVTSTGIRTTNRNLRPETGEAYALGATWEPDGAPGSRFSVTAWDVRIDDLIGFLLPQLIVNNPSLFPGFVTRGPTVGGVPGPITQLQLSETNFGFVQTRGIDLEASRSWSGPFGRWSVGASATRVTAYDVALAPGLPESSRLGRRFGDNWAPKWKSRLTVGIDAGSWSVGISSRYLATYKDTEPSDRTLGGIWTHDFSASLNLTRLGISPGGAKLASVSMAINNLTNNLPEYASGVPYFDYTQGDWRGRYAGLRLSMDW